MKGFPGHRRWGRCDASLRDAIAASVDEEAHAGPDWYRLYPPVPCHDYLDCVRGGGLPPRWPEQYVPTRDEVAAFNETDNDAVLRAFYAATDTAALHGAPQVPGHARRPPHGADRGAEL